MGNTKDYVYSSNIGIILSAKFNKLQELNLECNQIGGQKISLNTCQIQEQRAKNEKQDEEVSEEIEVMFRNLKNLNHLIKLVLRKNPLGPTGAKYLALELKKNKTLKILDIESTQIGSKGVKYISDSLHNNTVLQDLNIAGNKINTEGGARSLSLLLEINSTLQKLNISNTDMSIPQQHLVANSFQKFSPYLKIEMIGLKDPKKKLIKAKLKHYKFTLLFQSKQLLNSNKVSEFLGRDSEYYLNHSLQNLILKKYPLFWSDANLFGEKTNLLKEGLWLRARKKLVEIYDRLIEEEIEKILCKKLEVKKLSSIENLEEKLNGVNDELLKLPFEVFYKKAIKDLETKYLLLIVINPLDASTEVQEYFAVNVLAKNTSLLQWGLTKLLVTSILTKSVKFSEELMGEQTETDKLREKVRKEILGRFKVSYEPKDVKDSKDIGDFKKDSSSNSINKEEYTVVDNPVGLVHKILGCNQIDFTHITNEMLNLPDVNTNIIDYANDAKQIPIDQYKDCNPSILFLIPFIRNNTELTILNLNNFDMTYVELQCICEAMSEHKKVKKLDVGFNCNIGKEQKNNTAIAPLVKQAIDTLAKVLTNNTTLEDVNLGCIKITTSQTEPLLKALLKHNDLKNINLSDYTIGVNSIKPLTSILRNNSNLEKLNLDRVDIRVITKNAKNAKNSIQHFCEALFKDSLKELNINAIKFTGNSANALEEIFLNKMSLCSKDLKIHRDYGGSQKLINTLESRNKFLDLAKSKSLKTKEGEIFLAENPVYTKHKLYQEKESEQSSTLILSKRYASEENDQNPCSKKQKCSDNHQKIVMSNNNNTNEIVEEVQYNQYGVDFAGENKQDTNESHVDLV